MPPLAALLLGAFGAVSTKAAVWSAFGLGLGVLAVQGVVFARVERLRWPALLLVVAANLTLAVVLVALKPVVTHEALDAARLRPPPRRLRIGSDGNGCPHRT